MGAQSQAQEIIFQVQMKRSNEKKKKQQQQRSNLVFNAPCRVHVFLHSQKADNIEKQFKAPIQRISIHLTFFFFTHLGTSNETITTVYNRENGFKARCSNKLMCPLS
jgi:hypothetical protein